MPSTWTRWGTDADGNGVADPWNPVDAVYSAARYLAASGGAVDIRRAVFSYNHADWYVNEVLQLAQLYGTSTGAAADAYGNLPAMQRPVFVLDRLQAKLDDARAAVSQASDAYRAALDTGPGARRARAEHERRGCGADAPLGPARAAEDRRAGRRRRDRSAGGGRSAEAGADGGRGEAGAAAGRGARSVVQRACPADPLRRPRRGLGQLRLPRRRRAVPRLGLALPPRLPGCRHRRPGGLAALRSFGRDRPLRLELGPALRHRLHDEDDRRPDLDLLPPLLPRPGRDAGGRAQGRRLRRPGGADGRCDRAAPPSAAAARLRVPPGRVLVPELRRHRLPVVGRGRREAGCCAAARLPHRQLPTE